MPYPQPSSLFCTLDRVGKKPTLEEVTIARAVVEKQKHDDLVAMRQLRCQMNKSKDKIRSNSVHDTTQEMDRIWDKNQEVEIVQTMDNPDDTDVHFEAREGTIAPLNKHIWKTGSDVSHEQLIRSIPHFMRLNEKTRDLLPRYVFRVVHSESAGGVFEHRGVTCFNSHAVQTYSSAGFDAFTQHGIAHQLKAHISGSKSTGGKPFFSHFISTTDSFEFALNRAERDLKRKRKEITIYVIDTESLQRPALVLLMFLAMQAWDVSSELPKWLNDLYRYGSLTEWLFWDQIAATCVDRIDYLEFAKSRRISKDRWKVGLSDVVPSVIEAARVGGVPRTVLHATLYSTKLTDREREHFDLSVFVGRCGHLPSAPACVKDDKRANIGATQIENAWTLASATNSRNLVFMWLLSLSTQRFYFESIVQAVVHYHPEVVVESLQVMPGDKDAGAMKILVYYMPGPHYFGRVDVNEYQKLMEACIVQWDLMQRLKEKPSSPRAAIYIVTGPTRPTRNLLQLEELGLLGRCQVKPLLKEHGMTVIYPDLKTVQERAWRVVQSETDEEFHGRYKANYGTQFHAPIENFSNTTRNVKGGSRKTRCDEEDVTNHTCEIGPSQEFIPIAARAPAVSRNNFQVINARDENRLLLAQARPSPGVGSTLQQRR